MKSSRSPAACCNLPAGGGGTMTSGGTESILMSMLVNRERARARGVERPEIVAARGPPTRRTAKAAHYFGMDVVRARSTTVTAPTSAAIRDVGRADDRGRRRLRVQLPVRRDGPGRRHRRDRGRARRRAATSTRASAASSSRSSKGSVTTCRRGTSGSRASPRSSADVHKYGYAPKGASTVLHRDADWFGHQFFVFSDWGPGSTARPASPAPSPPRRSRPRGPR